MTTKMELKVVITARTFASASLKPLNKLKSAGLTINFIQPEAPLSSEAMTSLFADATAAIVGADRITEEVLEKASRLRVIAMHGVGVDHIDINAATRRGIIVTNAPGSNTLAVAELTIAFILALARNLVNAHLRTCAGEWSRAIGVEVEGKLLGLVGFGRIGEAVALRAKALGMAVQAYDPFISQEKAQACGVPLRTLEEIMATSDFVSIHVPLNAGTELLIGPALLDLMKPTAFLINTSRGRVIDEPALIERLRSRRIAGAALDVFWNEPPRDSELLHLPNVLCTPHMGAHTLEAIDRMSHIAAESVIDVLQGRRPAHVVNPEVLALNVPSP